MQRHLGDSVQELEFGSLMTEYDTRHPFVCEAPLLAAPLEPPVYKYTALDCLLDTA